MSAFRGSGQPDHIQDAHSPIWVVSEHKGLGADVFDALPKYLRAYNVNGVGIPPLADEFRVPLFLRIFCEAYSGQDPDVGVLSLNVILRHYAKRKAESIGQRIDCDPSRVFDALRELGSAMEKQNRLHLSERDAQQCCQQHHAPTESSKSLYRALLAENILLEFPGDADALDTTNFVRFTYERVWDYFLSLYLLPNGAAPSGELIARLSDSAWREAHSGVVSLLAIRIAEEGHGELLDLLGTAERPSYDLVQSFVETLSWRTSKSIGERTRELFRSFVDQGWIGHELDHILPMACNPAHPWNADWLHDRLSAIPMAERDHRWTFWVNEQFVDGGRNSALRELLNWAENGHLELVPDSQILLLSTALTWCSTTTVVDARVRLASALTRLVGGRVSVATRLLTRFSGVDDAYVRDRLLLAAAGAAQHCPPGDATLGELAHVVYATIFAHDNVEPHLLVRHYASEICRQAELKGVLPKSISPDSFKPPFRSSWPKIWSDKAVRAKRAEIKEGHSTLFQSVEPGPGVGYGDFGRYVMEGLVHHFQSRRLKQKPISGERSWFDAQIAKRYIIQRVFEIGWDATATDTHPAGISSSRSDKVVERLSKKYQWIALCEFLGYVSDHYHFHNYSDHVRPFQSARQLGVRDLLDPFVIEPLRRDTPQTWRFKPSIKPWWHGGIDPLPHPLSPANQCRVASERHTASPVLLLDLSNKSERWITLSSFYVWDEPIPFWIDANNSPRVHFEWAVRSYIVTPARFERLVRGLSQREVGHSTMWIQEPEFGQPLAALRTFPANQERLKERCQLDEIWETESWKTGAFCSTCRCATDEEQRRAREGSMPSPQLAEIGNLHWLGTEFEFAGPGNQRPVVRHVGEGFKGACVILREALLPWLASSGLRMVWRCYGFKYRLHEHADGNHARAYWSAFTLEPSGAIVCRGGATCDFPHGPGPAEPLPWEILQSSDAKPKVKSKRAAVAH